MALVKCSCEMLSFMTSLKRSIKICRKFKLLQIQGRSVGISCEAAAGLIKKKKEELQYLLQLVQISEIQLIIFLSIISIFLNFQKKKFFLEIQKKLKLLIQI